MCHMLCRTQQGSVYQSQCCVVHSKAVFTCCSVVYYCVYIAGMYVPVWMDSAGGGDLAGATFVQSAAHSLQQSGC